MTISVGPTLGKPTHHVKISKGSDELGLILCDQRGKIDPRTSRDPFPNTAIKTYTGDAKHSDREPPFKDLIQDDWSLGRGQEVLEDNKSRYQDSFIADTALQGKIILGPQPTFSTGIRKWGGYMPGNVEWQGLYGAQRYMERGWTTGPTFNSDKAEILLRKKGSPNSGVTIELRSSDLATTHKTIVIPASSITDDLLSVWAEGDWTGVFTTAVTTEYRLVVYATSGSDDVDNCWEIGSEPYDATSLNSSKSPDGSDWTNTSTQWGIYFRVVDDLDHFTAHFKEYREQLYFVTSPDNGSAAKLYMNGDRGACDDNTGALDRLKDSTKGSQWATPPGNVAKVIAGSAFQEKQNWRNIVGSGTSYVEVDPDWKLIHDMYDEYVILGSDAWVERAQSVLTKPATDIEVANDIMFIPQGAATPMYMHREVNSQGVFEWVDGANKYWYNAGPDVDFVKAVLDYISGPVLYMARNSGWSAGDGEIFREDAPVRWKESPIGFRHIYDGTTSMDEQSITNVTDGMENKISYLDVADAFTTGVIGSKDIASTDIRFGHFLVVMIKPSISLDAGVLEVVFDDTVNCASPILALALPHLYGGYWNGPIQLQTNAESVSGADAVISIGLRLTQDVPAVKIEMWHGFRLYTLGSMDPIPIPDTKITGLERYGEPKSCWVMAEDQLGEIRNAYYQPVPLEEIGSVRSDENGKAHLVHDVYLYFSLMDGLEKYYRQHLDDIGPNRDMGLPVDRQGSIVDLAGFPGRIYAALDGGEDGYSSVLCYNRGGWHEIYRSRFTGRRIRKIYIQSIPGNIHRRLWISEGADILWIPIAVNPLRDTEYRYTHESAVITSRIHGGMQDIAKFFKSVKLATKSLSAGIQIQVDYRTDVDTGWTRIASAFDTSPYQEENLSSTMDVDGRWIELRIVLKTDDNTITPEVFAWVLKSVQREEGKYANTYTFRVKDWDRDLQGNPIDETVSSFMSKLETMIDGPLPILINSISDLDDNKYAVAQPATVKRLNIIPEEDGRELHICQLTVLEI
jgi:hypothetical protein